MQHAATPSFHASDPEGTHHGGDDYLPRHLTATHPNHTGGPLQIHRPYTHTLREHLPTFLQPS